ncbi:ComF family protein [Cellulomonas sp. HZM]|uniref:ComF family protein n=1 Tax=Cellulomonas sp. HZM TaxID=1454010 RepID=UPI0009DCEE81|nr:phosphoribosyltransferase family protein [Cellulomonas sp. HZM]
MDLRGWSRELGRLVLPVACAGCGLDDVVWCGRCRALYDRAPWRCEQRARRLDELGLADPLPVWTVADGTGPARQVVVSWKDHARADLAPLLAQVLRGAARAVACSLPSAPLLVVPAPSTAASVRRRGSDLVARLAVAAADGLRDGGRQARAARVVRRRGGDQVGLGARERARNMAGRVTVRRGVVGLDGARVVLVDDVLTTGATLAACRRALEARGAVVVAALTLASTPPPGAARGVSPQGTAVGAPRTAGLAWWSEPTAPTAPPTGGPGAPRR